MRWKRMRDQTEVWEESKLSVSYSIRRDTYEWIRETTGWSSRATVDWMRQMLILEGTGVAYQTIVWDPNFDVDEYGAVVGHLYLSQSGAADTREVECPTGILAR